jgi:hypothetical protein
MRRWPYPLNATCSCLSAAIARSRRQAEGRGGYRLPDSWQNGTELPDHDRAAVGSASGWLVLARRRPVGKTAIMALEKAAVQAQGECRAGERSR